MFVTERDACPIPSAVCENHEEYDLKSKNLLPVSDSTV